MLTSRVSSFFCTKNSLKGERTGHDVRYGYLLQVTYDLNGWPKKWGRGSVSAPAQIPPAISATYGTWHSPLCTAVSFSHTVRYQIWRDFGNNVKAVCLNFQLCESRAGQGPVVKNDPFQNGPKNSPFSLTWNGLFSRNGLFFGPYRNGSFFTTGPWSLNRFETHKNTALSSWVSWNYGCNLVRPNTTDEQKYLTQLHTIY